VSVGPLSVDTDVSGTLGVSYTIALGQEMYFGGTVPPVMNLSADGYSFSPIVYEEPSGFYVVTYTVTP
jgi:hypothetical protein